jgi:hypothetical protein
VEGRPRSSGPRRRPGDDGYTASACSIGNKRPACTSRTRPISNGSAAGAKSANR